MEVFALPVREASARCDSISVVLRSEGALNHYHIPLLSLSLDGNPRRWALNPEPSPPPVRC